jgi:predicted component of type VI protein secretion system
MTALARRGRAVMKLLRLTTIVRDAQTATMVAQTFVRSPVLVGRQYGNQLRLDARIVSRRQGAFLFSKDGLQYIDYSSANGTYIDGARVPPNIPVDVRNSSLITIVPFQIAAHIDLVDPRRLTSDPNASTPIVALATSRSAPRDTAAERTDRAIRVVSVLADGMLAAGSRTAATLSPLRLAGTADELVALLLDGEHADERLAELRELLGELFRPRLSSVR